MNALLMILICLSMRSLAVKWLNLSEMNVFHDENLLEQVSKNKSDT